MSLAEMLIAEVSLAEMLPAEVSLAEVSPHHPNEHQLPPHLAIGVPSPAFAEVAISLADKEPFALLVAGARTTGAFRD